MHLFRLNFPVSFFALCLLSVFPLRAELSPAHQRLAATVAQGDSNRTIAAANAILKQSPSDSTALRVKAIALMDQEKLPDAIDLLRQALKADPNSVACRYYLAEALGTHGEIGESVALLDEVKKLAPGSEYARRADVVLPELRPMLTDAGARSDASLGSEMLEVVDVPVKRFNAELRAALEYDDNVPMKADNSLIPGPKSSGRAVLGWALDFTPLQQQLDSAPLTVGITYNGYESWQERSALNAYDVNQNIFGAYLDREGDIGDLPYRARLAGNWEYTEVGGEFFNTTAALQSRFDLQWKPWTVTSFHYDFGYRNFSDNTALPSVFSRDGAYQSVGFDQYFYLWNNRVILGVGYSYNWADTVGSQFESGSQNPHFSAQVELPQKITWRGQVDYSSDDYIEYTPNPQRLDNVWTFSTSVSRPVFIPNLSVELSYIYTFADSSAAFAEYQRQVVGLGLRYKY